MLRVLFPLEAGPLDSEFPLLLFRKDIRESDIHWKFPNLLEILNFYF